MRFFLYRSKWVFKHTQLYIALSRMRTEKHVQTFIWYGLILVIWCYLILPVLLYKVLLLFNITCIIDTKCYLFWLFDVINIKALFLCEEGYKFPAVAWDVKYLSAFSNDITTNWKEVSSSPSFFIFFILFIFHAYIHTSEKFQKHVPKWSKKKFPKLYIGFLEQCKSWDIHSTNAEMLSSPESVSSLGIGTASIKNRSSGYFPY